MNRVMIHLTKAILEGQRYPAFREVRGAMFKLDNPRSRLCVNRIPPVNQTRCFARMLFELSGSTSESFIGFYDPSASRFAKDGEIVTSYGERLYQNSQLHRVIDLLRRDPLTRRAVIQISQYGSIDDYETQYEFPCLSAIQFFLRDELLHCFVYMRSQNVMRLLPQDIFFLTMLHEFVAAALSDRMNKPIELGDYQHVMGSAHIFCDDLYHFSVDERINKPTTMPPFWGNDPFGRLTTLLNLEKCIRLYKPIPSTMFEWLTPVQRQWIVRLMVYADHKHGGELYHEYRERWEVLEDGEN